MSHPKDTSDVGLSATNIVLFVGNGLARSVVQQCTSHSLLEVRGWHCGTAPKGAAPQWRCHWHFSLLCAVSWAKVWNMTCPIQISSVKWWLWRKVRCTPVKVFQCWRSKWIGVAAYVPWSLPPCLPLIYFATPGLAVSPTLCCSWCLSFGGILTPAVIGESKCDIIRNSFHC